MLAVNTTAQSTLAERRKARNRFKDSEGAAQRLVSLNALGACTAEQRSFLNAEKEFWT
jgi:hypothetical protein